jgi:hypothetical protein
MSALGELTLIRHLIDSDSLDVIVREGLDADLLPTAELRKVYTFSLDYYFESGQTKAPSQAVLQTEYGNVLEDNEIDLTEEPEESIEWALDDLRGTFLYNEVASLNKSLAASMAKADSSERVAVVDEFASEFISMSMRSQRRDQFIEFSDGARQVVTGYEARKTTRESVRGMSFGLDMIDQYTHGIHPGELAVVASGPKVGKSYFMCLVALHLYRAGRSVALFSLENPIQTMLDRMACLATAVPSRNWQHGKCTPDEEERVLTWLIEAQQQDNPLWVCQPDLGRRNFESMVHDAIARGAEHLLIDQLTFVELPDPRKPKHERIGDALHMLHTMLSSGRNPLDCLLAHQINREGVKAAAKVGHLEMHHLADGAEVERTSDWVFGLYRSQEEMLTDRAKFQTLAARRDAPRHFQMIWNIDASFVNVTQPIEL